jgi:hypothetical protein
VRSVEFNYARHRQRDIPLVPVSLRTGGKWSEEDELFVVEVPELPGFVADGETYEGAFRNALDSVSKGRWALFKGESVLNIR